MYRRKGISRNSRIKCAITYYYKLFVKIFTSTVYVTNTKLRRVLVEIFRGKCKSPYTYMFANVYIFVSTESINLIHE